MTAKILPFVRRSDPAQHPERRSLTPVPPHIERKDEDDDLLRAFYDEGIVAPENPGA